MECKNASESVTCTEEGGTSVCEEDEAGWLTSTPQPLRRPLVQLNTASPRPQLTPYRYHGCKAIPEEREDQENIDPSIKGVLNSCASVKSSGMSPENTTHTGSGSSPFAYPLIWESNHTSITTPSSSSPSDGKKSQPAGDVSAWKSPISHYTEQRSLLAPNSEGQGVKGGSEAREDQQEAKEGNGKVRNRSGSSNEASSNKVACHHGPSVTPSKATRTQTLTNASVFLTPSSSIHSNRPGESRGGQTPKQQPMALSASHHVNPFEVGAESLYLSAVSPSLFHQVVSPSQKVDANFRWSIDQMAALQPVNIETSPFTQVEAMVDPDYERKAQDAIDRFFTMHQSVVPSPWTGSNKSASVVKKMCVQQSQASPCLPPPRTQSVWCQTELSLPPILPQALEEALKPFCSFTQNQWWQGQGEGDEAASLNNTTLRRKLLFSQEDVTSNTNSQGDSEPSSPSASHSLHCDDGSSKQAAEKQEDEGEEEESGLVWCTAVVGLGMSDGGQEGANLMRHSPPTPPPVCATTPTTTTTTPTQAIHTPGTLPLSYAADDGLLGSLDMSPIHALQYSSDLEAKQTIPHMPSPDASYLGHPHTSHTFISPNETPPASTCPSLHTPPLSGVIQPPGTAGEWGRSSPGRNNSSSSPQGSHQPHSPFREVLSSESHMGTKEEQEEEEEEAMQSDQKEVERPVNMNESFCSQNPDKQDMELRSPATSSPTTELRSSSNSGHFSSSPIRDISHSPLEVDSPARRFSASPPLSPILCRPLIFPTQFYSRLQSVPHVKESKQAVEMAMMEESEVVVPSAITTLQRCSSLCDMEMDSQPSVESNLGEEAVSQDTGYQTVSSLLTSNFSCSTFPQDLPPLLPQLEAGNTIKHLPSTSSSKEFRS